MLPDRSIAANFAKSVFFEDINDIDVYIEDTARGYEKIFVEIISRVLAGSYRVAQVFPLGSRGTVVAHCETNTRQAGRPFLYVIDGDLFLLCGREPDRMPGLYVLPFYCIENLLVDETAVHDLLNEEHPTKLRGQLISEFNFAAWKGQNSEDLFKLFLEYAISFVGNPAQKTVAHGISKLISSNEGFLDEHKLSRHILFIRAATINFLGQAEYDRLRRRIEEYVAGRDIDRMHYISGKDYLLPLLKMRLKAHAQSKISDINIKIRLATRCSIEPIAGLKGSIFHHRTGPTLAGN